MMGAGKNGTVRAGLPRVERPSLWRRIWKNRVLYLMLLLPLAMLIAFKYLPMYGVQIAFRNYQPSKTIAGSEWVGLKYIIKFFENVKFWTIMKNTLVIGLYSVAVFPCAILLAICLNYLQSNAFRKTVQMVSYLPHFISTVVMCSIILQVFDAKTGLFNAVTGLLGIEACNYMGMESAFFPHLYLDERLAGCRIRLDYLHRRAGRHFAGAA